MLKRTYFGYLLKILSSEKYKNFNVQYSLRDVEKLNLKNYYFSTVFLQRILFVLKQTNFI